MTLYLHGLGHFHPDNEITNPFLESLELIESLGSSLPCAGITTVWSSDYQEGPSTIGREAAFLLEGYRTGRYPPGVGSLQMQFDDAWKEDWHRWWQAELDKDAAEITAEGS